MHSIVYADRSTLSTTVYETYMSTKLPTQSSADVSSVSSPVYTTVGPAHKSTYQSSF